MRGDEVVDAGGDVEVLGADEFGEVFGSGGFDEAVDIGGGFGVDDGGDIGVGIVGGAEDKGFGGFAEAFEEELHAWAVGSLGVDDDAA